MQKKNIFSNTSIFFHEVDLLENYCPAAVNGTCQAVSLRNKNAMEAV
jgi:hypothetical protein